MTTRVARQNGFTLIELLVVCVVIAILATLAIVAYQGIQQRGATAAVSKDLKSASEQLGLAYVRSPDDFNDLTEIPGDFQPSADVMLRFVSGYNGPYYSSLSSVQNGVLFYEICEELVNDPYYTTIHAREGGGTNTVIANCTDDIGGNRLQITSWHSEKFFVPVTRAKIEDFKDTIPYDDWWTDRQEVVHAFYDELMNRFEQRGGTFPITSFWDSWANEWSGVHKQDLPPSGPPPAREAGAYCVEAYHNRYPDTIYKITEADKVEEGRC